ncbi:hypothetical protein J8Y17_16950 [Bacillus cereus]|uniref:hypothetical protein n=1 Tax=Bacillus cereus group TaxID=86661 RepID=UPI001867F6AC|nr:MULTISPECIES: hypothetical protein [Bacillus cereus group]MBE3642851.1 hypothetical protein [Bacillus anthracis]MDA2120446.1 hypothetical protein [Bacillus cereus]QUW29857.1 hypothetical protein J8Y17_16950 [Bacillus cereus]
MNKWMVTRFRLILLCSTIIVAFLLAQGALYTREIFQEWMINNKKIYIIDGIAEAVSGGKGRYKTFSNDELADTNEPSGKLWIKEPTNKGTNGSLIPYLKKEVASEKNIIIYVYITIIIITFFIFLRIYKSRRNKKRLLQDKIENKKKPSEMVQPSIKKKKINALPHNSIRAELVKWERKLPISKQRRSYETIQQWLTRIGCSHEIIGVYEKIRYGDLAFTSDEKQFIHEWINKHT